MTWHSGRRVLLAAEDRRRLISFQNPPHLVRERFSRQPVFLAMCLRLKVTVPRVIIEARIADIYQRDTSATTMFSNAAKKEEAMKRETLTRRQGSIANTNDIAKRSSFLREVNTEFSRWIAIWQLVSTFIDRLDASKKWQPSLAMRWVWVWSSIQFHVDRNFAAWLRLCRWNQNCDQRKHAVNTRLDNRQYYVLS